MAKEKIEFVQVALGSLNEQQGAAHLAYLRAKEALREALQASAPEGMRLVFTEKYGTSAAPEQSVLKVALVRQSKAPEAKASLGEWLAAQASGGRSC